MLTRTKEGVKSFVLTILSLVWLANDVYKSSYDYQLDDCGRHRGDCCGSWLPGREKALKDLVSDFAHVSTRRTDSLPAQGDQSLNASLWHRCYFQPRSSPVLFSFFQSSL
jgi:hypothetical protein